ncbi:MAG: hypothetical protein ABI604_17485 [Nitrospirota bacterium]
MKAIFEEILGRASFMKVKDYGPLKSWKAEVIRLLQAVALSINATVEVADEEWKEEINSEIEHGILRAASSSEIDELFSDLSATLAKVVSLQIGFVPRGHRSVKRVALTPRNWKLNPVRSVQYVQNEQQRTTQKRLQKAKAFQHAET